jgi:hypothetical protein
MRCAASQFPTPASICTRLGIFGALAALLHHNTVYHHKQLYNVLYPRFGTFFLFKGTAGCVDIFQPRQFHPDIPCSITYSRALHLRRIPVMTAP